MPFYLFLAGRVYGCAQQVVALWQLQKLRTQMRCGKRQIPHPEHAQRSVFFAPMPCGLQPVQRCGEMWIILRRAPLNGILRHQHKGHALPWRQFLWRLVKIDKGSRAETFNIAAIGCKVEIGLKDFLLAELPVQLHSQEYLAQLGTDFSCFQPIG